MIEDDILSLGVEAERAPPTKKSYCCFYSQVLKMLAKHYYPITLFFILLILKYAFEGKNGGFYTVQY